LGGTPSRIPESLFRKGARKVRSFNCILDTATAHDQSGRTAGGHDQRIGLRYRPPFTQPLDANNNVEAHPFLDIAGAPDDERPVAREPQDVALALVIERSMQVADAFDPRPS